MSEDTILDSLVKNPRLIGFLFTMGMVMSQAGNVAANGGAGNPGP